MSTQTEAKGQTRSDPPLIAFEDKLSELCREDKYSEMAESFSTFVKTHTGITYLAFEPIPAKVSDHLIKKTQAPSAFMTMTLRHPTWANELGKSLTDPAAFQNLVKSLESEVVEIAKQTKKLS